MLDGILGSTSHFEVERETGYALCRIALWDSFGVAITSFIGCYEVAQDSGSNSFPENITIEQFDTTPTQSQARLLNG